MNKMLSLLLIYLLNSIYGHTDITEDARSVEKLSLKNDADLQAELMPQELNSEFVPGKLQEEKSPWHAIIPMMSRTRRDTDSVSAADSGGLSRSVKIYSRVVSCVALAVAAIIEIVLYVVEFYT